MRKIKKYKMLNFLFIVIILIIIVPYILRWAAPFLMKSFLNRVQKNMQNNVNNNNDANNQQSTDSQSFTKSQEQKPNKAKEELGDYVDFEDIKED